jgi:protein MPE1
MLFSHPPGHWIQNCPTNDDKEFDNKPRFKRTTGIPRSFLKTVDATAAEGAAGGIMITPEGGFVVAEPDS